MKAFIADILPKIERFSQKLDNTSLLTNQYWVLINSLSGHKTIYIFRPNNELLISVDGKVEKARWEFLGNKFILIEQQNITYLYKQIFFDENVLVLKIDNTEGEIIFINESKTPANSLDLLAEFLQKKYLSHIGINEYKRNIEPIISLESEHEERKRLAENDENDEKSGNSIAFMLILLLAIIFFIVGIFNK